MIGENIIILGSTELEYMIEQITQEEEVKE